MKEEGLSLKNYSEYDGEAAGVSDFRQRYIFMPDKVLRMLICGPSGSGKTNLLMNILLKPLIQYDELYLYSKSLDQPKYSFLRERLENVGDDILFESNDEIIPIDDMPTEGQKVVVFDDFICENQKSLIEYFIRGRNKNCSIIYLAQSFFKCPKDIRLNCSHFCVFDTNDTRDKKMISKQLNVDPDKYDVATREPYSFLYVDNVKKLCARNFFGKI